METPGGILDGFEIIYYVHYSTFPRKNQGGIFVLCIKCGKNLPDDAAYCMYCGRIQTARKRSKRTRGNGTGTVYRDRGSNWIAEITVGYYMQDGKLRRKSRRKYGFRTKKDAVNYLAALQTASEQRKHITVSELYAMFTESSDDLSRSKRQAYRTAWRKISDAIGYRSIDDITVPELQELVDATGTSYYTKRDIKSLLSHCYKLAIRDDYTDKNRAQYIQIGRLEASEREVLTEEEIRLLWDDYRQQPTAITGQMLIMLYTGIRPGELLTIRTENVHLDEQWMSGGIKTAKGKARKIILPDKILPVMDQLLRSSRAGLIAWYNKPNDFYNAWIAKRSALNIREEITPYCCRHTYITRLTALKVSPAMLQELAGHEDYDTTLEYTHLSVTDRLAEVNRLE